MGRKLHDLNILDGAVYSLSATTSRVFALLVAFVINVFLRVLAEIRFGTIMKSPQTASFETKMCSFGTVSYTHLTLPTILLV